MSVLPIEPKVEDGIRYYDDIDIVSMFKEEEYKKFYKWMNGQTCPVVSSGRGAYYSWDVERFAERVLRGLPTYFD